MALKDTSTNIQRKDRTWRIILEEHLIPGSDLVSFLKEGNCLGLGTCAAMLCRNSSVWLCGSAGITILRGRRPSGLASTCLNDGEIRCKIHYIMLHYSIIRNMFLNAFLM